MQNVSSAALRRRRHRLIRGLPPIEQIVRGSLIETYKRCGRPNCHCADGPGHGPKRYLSTIARTGDRPRAGNVSNERGDPCHKAGYGASARRPAMPRPFSRCPRGVSSPHGRSSESSAEGEAGAAPAYRIAGKSQAPQGASQRPLGRRSRGPGHRNPRFRRNCRG